MRQVTSLGQLLELATTTAPRVVVVDFYAQWCGPCKVISPHFEAMALRFTDVAVFVKVDVDVATDVRDYASIRAMPTFHIYRGAERIFELVGANLPKLEERLVGCRAETPPTAPAPVAHPPRPVLPRIPVRSLLQFDRGKVEPIRAKISALNSELVAEGHAAALQPDALAALLGLCDGATGSAASGVEAGLAAAHAALGWPAGRRWPVLDLLRLCVVRWPDSPQWDLQQADGARAVLGGLSPHSGAVEHMCALRMLCNLLARGQLDASLSLVPLALEAAAAAGAHESPRPATRLALCTLLLNAAVLLRERGANSESKTPAVCAAHQVLASAGLGDNACTHAVCALGTLAWGDAETAALCIDLEVHETLSGLGAVEGASEALCQCAAEVRALLMAGGR